MRDTAKADLTELNVLGQVLYAAMEVCSNRSMQQWKTSVVEIEINAFVQKVALNKKWIKSENSVTDLRFTMNSVRKAY